MRFLESTKVIILCFGLLLPAFAEAQIKAVNDKGEKIILYPDGSWEYDKEGQPAEEETPPEKPPKEKKPAKPETPIYTQMQMKAARQDVMQRYQRAKGEKTKAVVAEDAARKEMDDYKAEIDGKRKMGQFPKSPADEAAYTARMKRYGRAVKEAGKVRKAAVKEEKYYKKILNMAPVDMMPAYEKMKAKESGVADDGKPGKAVDPKKEFEKQLAKVEKQSAEKFGNELAAARARSATLEKYRKTRSVMDALPAPCHIAYDEMDVFSGEHKRGTKRSLFFRYTDDIRKAALREKDHLVCEGFISEANGKKYMLALEFTINSKAARAEFGALPARGKLLIKLLNGETVTLFNLQEDSGEVDLKGGTTTFKGYYPLEKAEIKQILASEVSMARVVWATGYEDYEVYQLDFFREHFDCLRNGE